MTKPLSWGPLLAILVASCQDLPDQRTGKNRQYTISDAALGAFGVFFTQTPSFLAHQRDMQRRKGCNNAQSLFGVAHIPSDPQIRNLLDPIAPEHLRPPFWTVLERLEVIGEFQDYRSFGGGLLVMEPEFVLPQDGAEKQDCERNAARRWIERNALRLAA